MAESDRHGEHALRERAYYIWERDGRPEGQADNHWRQAIRDKLGESGESDDAMDDEEKVLAGRSSADIPALLTQDVPGG